MKISLNLKSLISLIFLVCSLFLLIYSGIKSYEYGLKYEKSLQEIAKISKIDNIVKLKVEDIMESISFGFVKSDLKKRLKEKINEKKRYRRDSFRYFYYFFAILAVILLLEIIRVEFYNFALAFSLFVSLVLGIISPVLMITIHKNIEYLGEVVLSFDSKSIIESVFKLYDENEWLAASLIFVFSVIIPILKSVFLILYTLIKKLEIGLGLLKVLKILGKYSMVDIFVISILVVYLSSSGVGKGDLGIGFYFFLVYVSISIYLYFRLFGDKTS